MTSASTLFAYARENNLSNEQTQKLLDRENDAAQAGVDAMKSKAKALSEAWLKEAQADKEIGGEKFKETVSLANDALEKLFPGVEIKKFMDETGFGNNPAVLKGFRRIGEMLKNDTFHKSGAQPVPKTITYSEALRSPIITTKTTATWRGFKWLH